MNIIETSIQLGIGVVILSVFAGLATIIINEVLKTVRTSKRKKE